MKSHRFLVEAIRKARKLARLVREPAYRSALRHGVAAAVEHDDVAFGREFATIVDAGAGRGQFGLFARRRFPGASLHCFEPLPQSREKLAGVLPEPVVTIYPLALGASEAELDLHVSRQGDSSSLLPITERQASAYPGTEEVGRYRARMKRLDKALDPASLRTPCLLKIDVQGYELEVLRGAGVLLGRFDEILVECSFVELYAGQALASDVVCALHEHGFRLTGISSISEDADRRPLQADFLFAGSGRD